VREVTRWAGEGEVADAWGFSSAAQRVAWSGGVEIRERSATSSYIE